MRDALAPVDSEPVITAEAPGEPPDAGQRLRVILDPDDPTKSVAMLPPARPGAESRTDVDQAGDWT